MEIFGYFILIIFAILGLGALVLFALPYVLSIIKTTSYKVKKQVEVNKIDIDAKAEAKKLRDEKLREKQQELEEKKVILKINKLQSKINSVNKDLEIQETLKAAEDKKEEITVPTETKKEEVVKEEPKEEVKEQPQETIIEKKEEE